jgi:dTDP-D-glucose 4,6-dehydratase
VVVSNCSNNYGPYHFPEKLIPLTILNALDGKDCPFTARARISATGCCRGSRARARSSSKRGPGETYNVGGRNERKNIDVVRRICQVLDRLRPAETPRENLIRFVTDRPGHDARYAIDATKLEDELGWKARENFDTGIERPCSGISTMPGGGARCARAMAAKGWACWRKRREDCRYRQGGAGRHLAAGTRGAGVEVIALGRPELDLADPASIEPAIRAARPDVVVSAAAYTAVDKAEGEAEAAFAINATGPGEVARVAAALGVPLIHISTDYVFDGSKPAPYGESDPVAPLGVYGASKKPVSARCWPRIRRGDPAHGVGLQPVWRQFRENHAAAGRNPPRTGRGGRPDRQPHQRARHCRWRAESGGQPAGRRASPARHLPHDRQRRGELGRFRRGDLCRQRGCGRAEREGQPHRHRDYPTPAARPANSRLDCAALQVAHGVRLPDWRASTAQWWRGW